MKILIISVGKQNDANFNEAINDYSKRISRYFSVEWKLIPSSDKERESESILKVLNGGDFVVALDDKGKELNTIELSEFLEKRMVSSNKRVAFVIGGAYGIGEKVQEAANFKWSLSKLTFPHQLARLILVESIYRAISVTKNEPYHHA